MITIDPFEGNKPRKVILEKPSVEMTRHIRPLYVRAHFDGKLLSKVLVDNGPAVNTIPFRMLRTLGRSIGDLIKTKVSISAFIGEISKTLGVLLIEITVGSTLSAFFVINSIANYNALLGRDWIHANWFVPSFLYQFLLFWKGDEVEVVWADKQHFIATADSIETNYYDQEFGPIKFKGKNKNGTPREIYMESRDGSDIQDQAAKLMKTSTILPFKPIKGLVIEEIDD